MAGRLLRRGHGQVAAGREAADGHELRVGAPALAGVGVQEADDGVDVVDGGGEGVRRCVAVGGGDDDGAGGACHEVAETPIELWEAAHKCAAVYVEMQWAQFSGVGVAGLFLALE